MGTPSNLYCSRCAKSFEANQLMNLCECDGPLLVEYDLAAIGKVWVRDESKNMQQRHIPCGAMRRFYRSSQGKPSHSNGGPDATYPCQKVLVWLDGCDSRLFRKGRRPQPDPSFKARGLCLCRNMAKKLGAKKLAIPSAGMRPVRWPPTLPLPDSKRISLCPATCLNPTISKAWRTAQRSLWLTA